MDAWAWLEHRMVLVHMRIPVGIIWKQNLTNFSAKVCLGNNTTSHRLFHRTDEFTLHQAHIWNIPSSIMHDEIISGPKGQKFILKSKRIEVISSDGEPLNVEKWWDWNLKSGENFLYLIRTKPGWKITSLRSGQIFMFPNETIFYIHRYKPAAVFSLVNPEALRFMVVFEIQKPINSRKSC